MEQMEQQLNTLTQKVDKINQDVDFRLKELETKPAATPAKPVIIDKSSDKDRYNFAYEYIKKGDYAEAQKLLTEFTKDFPKSSLMPNALYWLGETYYTQGQYENAVGFFADVFSKHKTSSKAPDALFKMGLSMKALNNNEAACSAWKGLIAEYPKADATLKKRTQEEIKKSKCPS
jgi:tol-pal system protein YbgF